MTRVIVREKLNATKLLLDVTFGPNWGIPIPAPLDWVQGIAVSPLFERKIDEDGLPTEEEEWIRTEMGGHMWATFSSIAEMPRCESAVFPDLQDLGIKGVLHLTGTMTFTETFID
ncbi:hypothetical protein BCR33DRAFT_718378 [Rhizoclosmatium globosum]|uniref:Uncharacterized protein n=1 Tax=Rhizoclosmatium globosum TaxID=329046 RepID=A0A1Y2C7A3_9FUNG|nr:hypothetical protein BCR33DRAFT_718378 [Rhizoclosmatium globosum]|eukprot:ORY42185.1 hypothetical protein BCR33DRAFT_718378 [Rhizoclosmatium globosum]